MPGQFGWQDNNLTGILEGTENKKLGELGSERQAARRDLHFWIHTHTCVQNSAYHSRHHNNKHGQEFQVSTHDTASLHMGHVLARETSLDNNLSARHSIQAWFNQEQHLLEHTTPSSRYKVLLNLCDSEWAYLPFLSLGKIQTTWKSEDISEISEEKYNFLVYV